MQASLNRIRRIRPIDSIGLVLLGLAGVFVPASAAPALSGATLIALKGQVELSRAGATAWDPAQTNQVLQAGDRLRTGENSRATLRLRDATVTHIDELGRLRITEENNRSVIELLRGVMSIFHRDDPEDVEVRGAGTSAIIRGTEFAVTVDAEERMELVLYDGSVEMTNAAGRILARTGDVIQADAHSAPTRSPSLAGTNRTAIQWILHYPAVLDPADVKLSPEEAARWQPALALYRSGALLPALGAARALGEPSSDSTRLLRAALHLGAGDVPGFEQYAARIDSASPLVPLRDALRTVLGAARFDPDPQAGRIRPRLSVTERLAESYRLQSRGQLDEARELARDAVKDAPGFGFAHARAAALEFAHGRVSTAREFLAQALELSPRNADAVALDGFLLAAHGRFAESRVRFDEALQLDPALPEAWLGRGLVRFRTGDRSGGRLDLEMAAALDPLRSVLRSYLAKAFAEEKDDTRALEELTRARELDPLDPTTGLYTALLRYRRYELADAISELESSRDLNDQRAVYRSRLLLDQDAAVRSANLANVYELADLSDVSRRESARAVAFDYSSHSAHLNLASSYNALRDPTRFNLRNETVWFNEHLLASLLAPTDGAPLSQNLSQNEYSRLFAGNRVGLNTTTEYFGSGEWRQLASQVGNFSRLSYALDLDYNSKPGFRPNEDFSRIEWYTRAKAQLTPADSVLFLAKYQEFEGGDLFQYADLSNARPDYRFRETQNPILLGGYHHEWGPGSHTLFLGGRLVNRQQLDDRNAGQLVAFQFPDADPLSAPMDLRYRNDFETYTAELSQILQSERHTTVVGARYQAGEFNATAALDTAPSQAPGVFDPVVVTEGNGDLERKSLYAYHTWEILSGLRLTGGVSYDDLTAPSNFRRPPLQSGERDTTRWSPKAALVYSPSSTFTLRGLYAESLGGVSYDESIRLEPTQLAGFPQAFRTLISESLVGSVETPRHRSTGLGIDFRLPTRTYLSVEGTWLESRIDQDLGFFAFDALRPLPDPLALPASAIQQHRYRERSARLIANQILAEEWFVQGLYQFTRSELDSTLPDLPAPAGYARSRADAADLHTVKGSLLYQRTDGWFSRFTTAWYRQDNSGISGAADEDFAHLSFFVGYRFPRHLGELTVGVLNLTDRNYGLSPLTPYDELPRERMIYLRLRLQL